MDDGGEGASTRTPSVRAELRDREVSASLAPPILDAASRHGITADSLTARTGYSPAQLRDRHVRIPWTAFMTLTENLGHALPDDAIVALGTSLLDNPVHRALLIPGRLLFTLPEIYRWGARPDGPLGQLLTVMDMEVTELDSESIRFDVTMKPGYAATHAFWLLRLGFLRSVSVAFGLSLADVSLTEITTGASYAIRLPKQTGLLARARRRVSWLVAAKDVGTHLQIAHDDLHERYLQLQREVKARTEVEERLRELNADLEARVRERTSSLEAANRDLAVANSELTLFSAAVAHDLRAPVRIITGFAEMLAEDHGAVLDAGAKRQIARIVASAERMDTLIEALLSLSKITRADMRVQTVDLGAVAKAVLEDLRTLQPGRDVRASIDGNMKVEGDPGLVRALMENLLGNAWKFTRERSPAHIEVAQVAESPEQVFRVSDDGAGFDMQHVEKLFAPFQRAHSPERFDGTGIGLATVDRIVRRHGGRIWVDAIPDVGATFSFTLRPLPSRDES